MKKNTMRLVLFLQLLTVTGFGQDISSALPIYLPPYPAPTYVVNAGQTVRITSKQSVVIGGDTWFKAGSNVSIKISSSPTVEPAPNNGSPDLDKNWVHVKDFDENNLLIGESKAFFDKTGKPLQSQVKSLSMGHVLASQSINDALGRPAVQALSAPINSSEFGYKIDFVSNASGQIYSYNEFDLNKTNSPDPVGDGVKGTLGWYYSDNNTFDAHVPRTQYPYSRTDFYSDGTGSAKRSASIGDPLKMGSGHESRSYTTQVTSELAFYLQLRNKFFTSSVIGDIPTSLTQVSQAIVADANGREAIIISDKGGKPLMTARPGNDLNVTNIINMSVTGKNLHYFKLFANTTITQPSVPYKLYNMGGNEQEMTWPSGNSFSAGYYKVVLTGNPGQNYVLQYSTGYTDISFNFYNQSGQLIAAVAPNGVRKVIVDGLANFATLDDVPFVTKYEYDLQGRMIANTQTDAGRTEFIYRKDGSVRFTQNAVQRMANPARFSYTNYDRWGRAIESGEYVQGSITFSSAKTDLVLQESIAADGGLTGGTKLSQVKTFYDEMNNSHGKSGYTQDEGFLKGSVSYTENSQAKTWYNYDSEGRIVWVIKQISGLGTKTIDYTYDSMGNVLTVDYEKNNSTERFTHEYEYDEDNRLKVAFTSASGAARKEQARYYYYLHGPLKRVELAENLQGIDYVYTPDGALKSINHPVLANDPGKDGTFTSPDVFGMTLEYFNGDYMRSSTGINSLSTGGTASYAGDIMAQSWRSQKPQAVVATYDTGVNSPSMVTYSYNDKYQFNSNKFGTPDFSANGFTELVNANREHGLSYDANGNITALSRTNASGANIANFSYNYQSNTNKLASVSNYASYNYDNLGQMTAQVRQGGAGYYVDYDVNGKVTAIYSDSAKTQLRVSFGYDESGNRIRKTDHVQNNITYYLTDASGSLMAVYDNKGTAMQQKQVPIYAASRVAMYNRPGNSYQYELTDHLGNVRVVINGTKQGNGQADVIYYSDYYPYGSPLTLAANDYRYGYQGQYAEADKETGWNNFQLRMYDPAIGRWMSTDPYEQYHSPYVGMGNNPVSKVDPDGGCDDCPPKGGNWLKEVVIRPAGKFFSDFGSSVMQGAGNIFQHIYNNPNHAGYGYSQNMPTPDAAAFSQYNVNWGNMIDPTHQAFSFANNTVSGIQDVFSGDGRRFAQGLPKVASTLAIVGAGSRGIISEIRITTPDGFLLRGFTIKTPFNINVQRFGNMNIGGPDVWGARIGTSTFANRTFAAIKPEWNTLTQYTTGIIPKGTPIKFGIIGPQGLKHPGGSVQFIVDSKNVINQSSWMIMQ